MVDVRIEGSEALVTLPGARQAFVFNIPEGADPTEFEAQLREPDVLASVLPMDDRDVRVAMAKRTPLGDALQRRAQRRKVGETQSEYDIRQGGELSDNVAPSLSEDLTLPEKAAMNVAQGATFGFSDKIIATALATVQGGTPEERQQLYDHYLTKGRATLDAVREDNQLLSIVSEVIGALGTGAGMAKGLHSAALRSGIPAAQRVARSSSPMATIGKAAGIGGIEGGVYAAGAADDAPTLEEIGQGGGIGALFGLAAGAGIRGISAVADWALRQGDAAMRALGIDDFTRDLLERAAGGDAAAIREIRDDYAARGPDAMPVDVLPGGADVVDAIIQQGGPGGQLAKRRIGERASDAAQAMEEATAREIGPSSGGISSRSISSENPAIARAYERAYARPVDYSADAGGDRLLEMLEKQVPPEVFAEAQKLFRTEGGPGDFFTKLVDGKAVFSRLPELAELDTISRTLYQSAEASRAPSFTGTGKMSPQGRAEANLARKIREILKAQNPDYREALNIFSGIASKEDAVRVGRDLFSDRLYASDVAKELRGLGSVDRGYVKQGIRDFIDREREKIKTSLTGLGERDYAEGVKAFKLLSSPSNRRKVAAVIGDDAAERLFRQMDQDAVAFQLKALTNANSKTAVRQFLSEMMKDMASQGLLGGMRASGAVRGLTDAVLDKLLKDAPQKEQDRLMLQAAELLTRRGAGPEVFDLLAQAVRNRNQRGDAADRALGFGSPAGVAGSSAYRSGQRDDDAGVPR